MQPKFWFNGQPVDQLPANNRGLHYGDGHFTTAPVVDGRIPYWQRHRQRLQLAGQRLQLPALDWAAIEQCVGQQIRTLARAVVKLVVTRGPGGRGYSSAGCRGCDWLLGIYPLPADIDRRRQAGLRVGCCQAVLGHNPALAGLKHLNRLEQVLARREVDSHGWDEGLVCDSDGYLVEATSANLLWFHQGRWHTPSLHYCGVAGIMRQVLCEQLAATGQPVVEGFWSAAALSSAEAVILCNSVQGIVPVRAINAQHFELDRGHRLQAWLTTQTGEPLAC